MVEQCYYQPDILIVVSWMSWPVLNDMRRHDKRNMQLGSTRLGLRRDTLFARHTRQRLRCRRFAMGGFRKAKLPLELGLRPHPTSAYARLVAAYLRVPPIYSGSSVLLTLEFKTRNIKDE